MIVSLSLLLLPAFLPFLFSSAFSPSVELPYMMKFSTFSFKIKFSFMILLYLLRLFSEVSPFLKFAQNSFNFVKDFLISLLEGFTTSSTLYLPYESFVILTTIWFCFVNPSITDLMKSSSEFLSIFTVTFSTEGHFSFFSVFTTSAVFCIPTLESLKFRVAIL